MNGLSTISSLLMLRATLSHSSSSTPSHLPSLPLDTLALVNDVSSEVSEGDARQVLCEAVDKYHASILVVNFGSVSDYCAHHAHCSVMVVRKPKTKTKH
ncbi:unnamed protein product [Thlaspi arvense]|uniref:UspA domain-containing protein n=1 Tax=Thlaspi arvense TaxID=13288 RepID=A0AAU9RJW0_THLAR|nr:unnamed protein product [Thlaspi arvense]